MSSVPPARHMRHGGRNTSPRAMNSSASKEDKARRESELNTQFAKKLREEFDAKQ